MVQIWVKFNNLICPTANYFSREFIWEGSNVSIVNTFLALHVSLKLITAHKLWSPWLFKLAFPILVQQILMSSKFTTFVTFAVIIIPFEVLWIIQRYMKKNAKLENFLKFLRNVIEDILTMKNIKISWVGIKMLVTYIRNWMAHFFHILSLKSFFSNFQHQLNLSIICNSVPSVLKLKLLHLVMFLQCSYSKGKVPKLLPHNQLFT